MVSLWSGKKDDGDEEGENGTAAQSTSHSQIPRQSEDATERTHLLHPPPHAPNRGDGYLDPDDPAVCWTRFAIQHELMLTGLPIQPLVRQSSTVLRGALPHDHVLVVGAALRLHLRQPATDALSRFGLL